ncbi:MAG: UDP-N-acetylmuramate dehydrogenase [Propionibacteriaceae bacterium]|jgi:UDP-N-acetylmuramate dehydrogenase|nr:UDP-N-acetylmuramate dehydrogenase [Propionibacteriaceae bacterium]
MCERLADHTTIGIGGCAERWASGITESMIVAAAKEADAQGEPLLILGGGSNMLVSDDGFPGTVLAIENSYIKTDDVAACSGAFLEVGAGTELDTLVQLACESGYRGIESLSGIPGTVGGAVIQNAGAYGQELSQTLARMRVYDRQEGRTRTLSVAEGKYGYRDSIFKHEPDRYVVLAAHFQFRLGDMSMPIRSGEVAELVGVQPGETAPLAQVRKAVLDVRRRKGMLLEAGDPDSRSAGSFFMNPILSKEEAAKLPADAPRYPAKGGVKTSAAWLIQHSGFDKGYGDGPAKLSSKHVLAITNRGGASADDVLALAREVRGGVEQHYGIELQPEPVLVGFTNGDGSSW